MGCKIRQNKRGQVTIFIIIGLLVVAAIILILLLSGKIAPGTAAKQNPQEFLDSCLRADLDSNIQRVLAGGGRTEPELFIKYDGEKYNYLCYNQNWYMPCINHYPMLKGIIEDELTSNMQNAISNCFSKLKSNLQSKGFEVDEGAMSANTQLLPGRVELIMNRRYDVTREGSSQTFNEFNVVVLSRLTELAGVAREITSEESQFCNFEYSGFMLLYPEFNVKVIAYQHSKLYWITDTRSGELFKFAIRSCAMPPGL